MASGRMNPTIAHRLTNGKQEVLNFNFKSLPKRLNIPICTDNLRIVKSYFRHMKVTFWLMYGTLLGAVRDKGFIPYDHDIDLGVYETDMERIVLGLPELEVAGFKVIRTAMDDGLFTILRQGMYIDFYVMSRCEMGWHYGPHYETKDYFSQLSEVPFLETTFMAPANPVEFLEDKYGDWKTPRRGHAPH